MLLFLLFIAIPLIEIALFIQLGGLIGLGWTLLIVVVTAVLGAAMVRSQGTMEMNRLRRSMADLDDPSEPLAHGAMILFSGALLLTPGFFTDALGFALLIPGVRKAVFAWARKRVNVRAFQMGPDGAAGSGPGAHRPPCDRVVDAEFEDIPPEQPPREEGSGWTRH
ncbi:FxsA family protein [Roseovarius sp. SYSU LYC5161]|uniref:FxsA family protein n=1 Tax=Roseovarius halophilus (ex Wu et al. 2025) TaxID=3376060 RepID=UPI00399A25DE